MDASAYPPEVHDYAEALLVLNGCMNLEVSGEITTVMAGEVYIVPAGLTLRCAGKPWHTGSCRVMRQNPFIERSAKNG